MSADDSTRTDKPAFRYAGQGQLQTFICLRCKKPTPQTGYRRMRWLGVVGRVHAACKAGGEAS